MARRSESEQRTVDTVMQIAKALGQMFPSCEVVVHDLTTPARAVLAIHNAQSGRAVGDPTTTLGWARSGDPDVPEVVSRYRSAFPDGRTAISTSIGIRGESGRYIAALCLNLDTSLLEPLRSLMDQMLSYEDTPPVPDTLSPHSPGALEERAQELALQFGRQPTGLDAQDRKRVVQTLSDEGFLSQKRAVPRIADALGVGRATVYKDLGPDT
ncbi:helix-turn-helix transcriptional regulator [Amycolatopsis jiangsuensis]|uniref:Putative transcriptional regulator YheO n=1 Tax=Amycolatopsis jiangsuensis TaxID=1181879 RepID=A0A840J5R7_9PSEU|nr:PAS domain-containing protein [Amycolatopsis jiangsuensis]MBB4688744.1 putative transcriptional regulator YheO [Amycolatopsis jiangsuensis]